jgi:hypothetical protein
LEPSPFHSNLSKLGIHNLYSPACGGILDNKNTT